ncbi:MAG: phosphate ABC transporter permease subunit PstC [Saprospiraceae bacterium]|nr:phosphate ABC transporter permease subunit PstC [Saprospiraceae bacterium]MDW8229133.1 phosphate ABC transporter permease subunit PstC [Saprospiraceae bacterium]
MTGRRYFWNRFFENSLAVSAFVSIATLVGIFLLLAVNSWKAFTYIGLGEFFSLNAWNPAAYDTPSYGIGALLLGTALTTLGATVIAAPLGVGMAFFLSEIAPMRLRNLLKPIVELMAAVPSVVMGFTGIVLVGPFLAKVFGLPNGLNALNGSILLAFMALPTVISISEDVVQAVPRAYKEASYALGANRWETLIRVTLPACYSGLLAAIMLGIGRAIGETMTVLMATGNATAMPSGLFSSVRTITATVAIEMGEVPTGTTHYYALFACALVLFLITLSINFAAERVAARLRKRGQ